MLTLFKYFLIGTLIGLVVAICGLLLLEVDNISSAEKRSKGTLEQSQLQLNGSASNSPPVALRNRVFVPSNVHELAFPKHAFERKATIFAWVSSLSNNQILDLLERSKDPLWNTSESNRFALQFTLLQKLSITAPDKAITFALSRVEPQRYTMASMVIQEWASTDLEAAVAHLRGMNIRDAEFFFAYCTTIVCGFEFKPATQYCEATW